MPRHESPEAQYDRLKKQLQDSILTEYPNPERKGCPVDPVVKELAERPLDQDLEESPSWRHVTHCSECYREFLAFRAESKRKRRRHRARVGWAMAAALIAIAAGVYLAIRHFTSSSRPPQFAQTTVFRPRIVDLEGRSETRSEEGKQETKPIVLDREPEELIIRLPFASQAGTYEVQLVTTANQPLVSATGEATIQSGTTSLTAKVDLSKFEPGDYSIGIRRVPFDWTYYPVVIR